MDPGTSRGHHPPPPGGPPRCGFLPKFRRSMASAAQYHRRPTRPQPLPPGFPGNPRRHAAKCRSVFPPPRARKRTRAPPVGCRLRLPQCPARGMVRLEGTPGRWWFQKGNDFRSQPPRTAGPTGGADVHFLSQPHLPGAARQIHSRSPARARTAAPPSQYPHAGTQRHRARSAQCPRGPRTAPRRPCLCGLPPGDRSPRVPPRSLRRHRTTLRGSGRRPGSHHLHRHCPAPAGGSQ